MRKYIICLNEKILLNLLSNTMKVWVHHQVSNHHPSSAVCRVRCPLASHTPQAHMIEPARGASNAVHLQTHDT